MEFIAKLEARCTRIEVPFLSGQVCWRRFGEGPALVLLHGGHGSWMHWARNIDALAEHHTVWVPDMPSFNDSSDLTSADNSMAPMVEALVSTLDILVPRETAIGLAGFSFGGLVATHLCLSRGNVYKLALLGAAGHGGTRRIHTKPKPWRDLTNASEASAALLHNLRAHMLFQHDTHDNLAPFIHENSCRKTRFYSKGLSFSNALSDLLNAYKNPVLLLWGEHDVTAEPEVLVAQFAGSQPLRECAVVAKAGHWIAYEAADEINTKLTAWFHHNNSPARSKIV
jgi:2-hydroxy-6-oxonona-2,4-dienedioate hydrolase